MTCREFIDFLMDYVDDHLPSDQTARFDEHLEICPDCVNYLESYRATIVLVKSAYSGISDKLPADVPENLIQAILSARRPAG